MGTHERAGQVAQRKDLVNLPKLMSHYYRVEPDVNHFEQKVSFGTSGHRGTSLTGSFNQHHIWAIAQAVADYRERNEILGPMLLGMDTHALSYAAYMSVVEVLVANKIQVITQIGEGFTPTPVISQAIVSINKSNQFGYQVDGLIITPSHNPPQDGGIKYNPPHGGPAEFNITSWIENKANEYLKANLAGVKTLNYSVAVATDFVKQVDFRDSYIEHIENVIDMKAIANSNVKIGVDPLGGSGLHYWKPIAEKYNLDITLVNDTIDPSFAFMTLDKDGKIRMDCSSPFAMKGLVNYQDDFDVCIGNDPDYDRHGIVCPQFGLMNPNHYLAVAIDYLLTYRLEWPAELAIGKTLVSSTMIDKICAAHQRKLVEVPVGFKWFVDGLANSTIAFGGEESAGAAFLQRDGSTWCTDKDGFILGLLAAEMIAVTGKSPAQRYQELELQFGKSFYRRVDSPVSAAKKVKFSQLTSGSFDCVVLAGENIKQILTHAPGNNAAIGGVKVVTENAWFAARPSGTEALFKIYAESFVSEQHLESVLEQAAEIIDNALTA
ncbi:MAG: phosphoglucomutase (alpha-D-glucose-1,6-bisphosphate-dependent) [Parashewanella sp.]